MSYSSGGWGSTPSYLADGVVDYLRKGQFVDAGRAAFYTIIPVGLAASALMDTRAWDTQRVVRTRGDMLALARAAFADAASKVPALGTTYAAMARASERELTTTMTIPQMFARVRDAVASSPKTRAWVVAKAAEYWRSVEQSAAGGQVSTQAVPPPGGIPPQVAVLPPADVPFYSQPWFAPVAVLSAVGVAAVAFWPRGRRS